MTRKNTEADFWALVTIGAPDECWLWTRHTNEKGYGRLGFGSQGLMFAHRLAYELHHKVQLPRNRRDKDAPQVMHTCDNPPCCNPAHLVLGTNKTNALDSVAKGHQRGARGSRVARARFTEEEVLRIRERLDSGVGVNEIAKGYGIRHAAISAINTRRTWRHI